MDKAIDAVFAKLMAMTSAEVAERLAAYKDNAFVRTLKLLNSYEDEVLVSKNDIEINKSPLKVNPVYDELSDWQCAANDERFALAA